MKIKCPICKGSGRSAHWKIPLRDGTKIKAPCSYCHKGLIDDWDEERLKKLANKVDAEQLELKLEF